jgi:hypothetical protein
MWIIHPWQAAIFMPGVIFDSYRAQSQQKKPPGSAAFYKMK